MSVVYTVALFQDFDDGRKLKELNELVSQKFGQDQFQLRDVSSYSGGSKFPDTTLLGGFNYLPASEYLELVASIDWEEPFLLVYRYEEDDTYITYTLSELRKEYGREPGTASATDQTAEA